MGKLYGADRECWVKYSVQIRNFYLSNYKGKSNVERDGEYARRAILHIYDTPTFFGTVESASKELLRYMRSIGGTDYGAVTCQLYFKNTINSFLENCQKQTGGFAPNVACMQDSDCPRGYRCRGVGTNSECVEEGEPYVAPKLPLLPLPEIPSLDIGADIKRSAQVTGMVVMVFIALIVYLMFVKGRGASGVTVGSVG